MKVFIHSNPFTLDGNLEVFNENQEQIFQIKGLGAKEIYDMKGNLLYVIRNRFLNIFSAKVFIENADGVIVASIKKHKLSLSLKYKISGTKDEIFIQGKSFDKHSSIVRNGQVVASLSEERKLKRFVNILDADQKDIPFYTAIVIALKNLINESSID